MLDIVSKVNVCMGVGDCQIVLRTLDSGDKEYRLTLVGSKKLEIKSSYKSKSIPSALDRLRGYTRPGHASTGGWEGGRCRAQLESSSPCCLLPLLPSFALASTFAVHAGMELSDCQIKRHSVTIKMSPEQPPYLNLFWATHEGPTVARTPHQTRPSRTVR